MKMLGIDPQKEGEFMEFETDTDKHLYMGFYHLVGKIIERPNDEGWLGNKLRYGSYEEL
jgi:hypothetical protein